MNKKASTHMSKEVLETDSLHDQVARWGIERAENKVSYGSAQEAMHQFAGDYAIVQHGGEPTIPVTGRPRGEGDEKFYTVSTLDSLTEDQLKVEIGDSPVTIVITCMDKRGCKETYDEVIKKENVTGKVIFLSMGGGIIQEDSIVREENHELVRREVFRGEALKTVLQYFVDNNINVEKVVATGHDCRCGACAFYNADQGVPEKLGVARGSQEEQEEMTRLIKEHALAHIPAQLLNKTSIYMAHFEGPDLNEGFASLKKLDLENNR